jgi:hypothetical protein
MYTWKYHMETPWVAILISNYQKLHVFLLSFILFVLQNRRTGRQNRSYGVGMGGSWHKWAGGDSRKGVRG